MRGGEAGDVGGEHQRQHAHVCQEKVYVRVWKAVLFTCEDFLTEVASIAGVALKQEKIISIVFCIPPQPTVHCSVLFCPGRDATLQDRLAWLGSRLAAVAVQQQATNQLIFISSLPAACLLLSTVCSLLSAVCRFLSLVKAQNNGRNMNCKI